MGWNRWEVFICIWKKQFAGLKIPDGNVAGTAGRGDRDASIKNIDEFISGNKSFNDVLDDFAEIYADKTNSNQAWSWDSTIPGGWSLTKKQRHIIRQRTMGAII